MGENLSLVNFSAVQKFKSVRRAIRRGHVAQWGIILPKRPFNNRKNKPLELIKRKIYESIKKSNG